MTSLELHGHVCGRYDRLWFEDHGGSRYELRDAWFKACARRHLPPIGGGSWCYHHRSVLEAEPDYHPSILRKILWARFDDGRFLTELARPGHRRLDLRDVGGERVVGQLQDAELPDWVTVRTDGETLHLDDPEVGFLLHLAKGAGPEAPVTLAGTRAGGEVRDVRGFLVEVGEVRVRWTDA